jgi:hypothetical protein
MDLASAISVASAVAALLSALYAASAARSARRSADLAEAEATEQNRELLAYLVDAIQWTRPDRREIVAIGFTLTNRASLPNTIIRTELVLHEYATTVAPSQLILTPIETEGPPTRTLQRTELPLNLAPRATVSGWLSFLVPDSFSKRKTIDKYELAFLDSTGKRTTIETYLMHKIVYAATDD